MLSKAGQPQNPIIKIVGPGFTKADQSLYERIGGEEVLDRIVTGVYDGMKADKEIGKFFARFRLEKLKERTVDYLRGEWGGEQYKGSDLWIAHSHLAVNNHQYDIMMKLYVKMLKKEKIGKKETQECLESLELMRAPTVDRDLKFKNMYLKHSEALAAAAGGDGWGVVSSSQKERDAKEKATLELIEKNKLEEAQRELEKKTAAAKAAAPQAASAPPPKAKAKAKAAAAAAGEVPDAAAEKAAEAPPAAPAKAKAKATASAPAVAKAPVSEVAAEKAPAPVPAQSPLAKAAGALGAAKAAPAAKAPPPPNPITQVVGPGFTKADQSLYERIGGEEKLDRIVTGVYDGMKADKEIGKFFARFRLEKLKERTVDYLRGEWGGEPYKGSDLWIAHSHLAVNNHQYDIMMQLYAKILKKEKIPKKEIEECLASLEKMRAPTVDRDLKFKNMYLKHSEALAKLAGGDGWGVTSGAQKEKEDRERAAAELAEKAKLEEAARLQATRRAASLPPTSQTPKAKAKPKPKPKAKPAEEPHAEVAEADDAAEVAAQVVRSPPMSPKSSTNTRQVGPVDAADKAEEVCPSDDSTGPPESGEATAEEQRVVRLADFDSIAIAAEGRVRLTVCM